MITDEVYTSYIYGFPYRRRRQNICGGQVKRAPPPPWLCISALATLAVFSSILRHSTHESALYRLPTTTPPLPDAMVALSVVGSMLLALSFAPRALVGGWPPTGAGLACPSAITRQGHASRIVYSPFIGVIHAWIGSG